MRVLAVEGQSDPALTLGQMSAAPSTGAPLDDLQPEEQATLDAGGGFRLLGFTLTPGALRRGQPFSLALYWHGVGDGREHHHATVHLRDGGGHDLGLADREVILPPAGRGLCTLFDLQVPAQAETGPAALMLNGATVKQVPVQ
jgi:hypothetical protein